MWVFVLLLMIPLTEIALFVLVGGWVGLWATLALVVITTLCGVLVLRVQGTRSMQTMQRGRQGMTDALRAGADGALVSVAGLLLILPGFLTDGMAALLLLPPVRTWLLARARRRFPVVFETPGPARGPRDDGVIIDAEFIELDEPGGTRKPGTSGWTQH